MRKRKWSVEALDFAVRHYKCYRQVIRYLGLQPTGGNYNQIKKYIAERGLSTAHFTGKAWSKGLSIPFPAKIPLQEILVKNSVFQSYKLKRRLFIAGLKPQCCEKCGWAKTTQDGYLPLELDHINGDSTDNRLENLRVLCPNCHSLQPTHRGRKRKV